MSVKKAGLLIVDDSASIRQTLSALLGESGHQVRSAENGFSALSEIRNEVPDIILADLNMPGMSGFEFLSVVLRRFPAVRRIAMSGAYSGDGVPPGVAADAFYEKGSKLASLLNIIDEMSYPHRAIDPTRHSDLIPIWIPTSHRDLSGESYVAVTCQECLRVFPEVLDESISLINETECVYCYSPVFYAIVQPDEISSSQVL